LQDCQLGFLVCVVGHADLIEGIVWVLLEFFVEDVVVLICSESRMLERDIEVKRRKGPRERGKENKR